MSESYNGYCVKCKEKRDFDGEATETNGRRMAKGTCPACGTKMNRILGKACPTRQLDRDRSEHRAACDVHHWPVNRSENVIRHPPQPPSTAVEQENSHGTRHR